MANDDERVVARHTIGQKQVSTAFLGVWTRPHAVGSPLLFETVIITPEKVIVTERYATWREAESGHARAIEMCRTTNLAVKPAPSSTAS